MEKVKTISVVVTSINNDTPFSVEVVEEVHADRSAGQWEAGWWVVANDDTEYFISESGRVYGDDGEDHDGKTKDVGHAPEIIAEAEKMERYFDQMYREELLDK